MERAGSGRSAESIERAPPRPADVRSSQPPAAAVPRREAGGGGSVPPGDPRRARVLDRRSRQPRRAAAARGRATADVVVIGGGYTGLWTAWHARRGGRRVVLLEAAAAGTGRAAATAASSSLDLSRCRAAPRARAGGRPAWRGGGARPSTRSAPGARPRASTRGTGAAASSWSPPRRAARGVAAAGRDRADLAGARRRSRRARGALRLARVPRRRVRGPGGHVSPARLAFGLRERLPAGARIFEGSRVPARGRAGR